MDTAWIALIGTVFGGAGLKLMESFLTRGSKKSDTATQMREELRKESFTLREELRAVEKELDIWKVKYFELFQDYIEMKGMLGNPQPPSRPPNDKKENDW